MSNFARKSNTQVEGKMKFALVKKVTTYKGKKYTSFKGSFSDGNNIYLLDMGELSKKYQVSDKSGQKHDAYFGTVVKLYKSGGR